MSTLLDAKPWAPVCIARADAPLQRLAATEHGYEPGQPLAVVRKGPLAALCARTEPGYFDGEDAEARLADVRWLAPRAARHDALVRAAGMHGPVLPSRFGAAFADQPAVRRTLAEARDRFLRALDAVDGREEHTLVASLDREAAADALADRMCREAGFDPRAGAGYLRRQAFRRDAALRAADNARAAVLATIARDIRPHCAAVRLDPPRAQRDEDATLVRCALLVAREDADRLAQAVACAHADGAAAGLRWSLHGPFPPYSFCDAG